MTEINWRTSHLRPYDAFGERPQPYHGESFSKVFEPPTDNIWRIKGSGVKHHPTHCSTTQAIAMSLTLAGIDVFEGEADPLPTHPLTSCSQSFSTADSMLKLGIVGTAAAAHTAPGQRLATWSRGCSGLRFGLHGYANTG